MGANLQPAHVFVNHMQSVNISSVRRWIVAAVPFFAFAAIGLARGSREASTDYLVALLDGLQIPLESQVAVFASKSAHGHLVSPENPRVIYFNDHTAVAWVRGSASMEVIDFSTANGPEFYTVDQIGRAHV